MFFMKIPLNNFSGNTYNLLREAGYHPNKDQRSNEASFSKSLSGEKYPRFHIYHNEKTNTLNLHLDQKAPRYKFSSDHGAEYKGDLVEKEAKRINSLLN